MVGSTPELSRASGAGGASASATRPPSPITQAVQDLIQAAGPLAELRKTADGGVQLVVTLDPETVARLGPVRSETTASAPAPAEPNQAVAMRSRVLIVDDDQIFRQLLRRILKQIPGCETVECAGGREALEVLGKGPLPDLCITDMSMPGMNGIDLIRQIRAKPTLARLSVILCTANSDRDVVVTAAGLNVSRYLVKPFQPDKVRADVTGLIAAISERRAKTWQELKSRLNLQNAACVELVRAAPARFRDTISDVRGLILRGQQQAASKHLASLRGLCSLLQDPVLGTKVRNLDGVIQGGSLGATTDAIDAVESESARVESLAAEIVAFGERLPSDIAPTDPDPDTEPAAADPAPISITA